MATNRLGGILRHLRRAVRPPAEDQTDAGLLELYRRQRDEAAFESLVLRHGPMVLGVCRRVLANDQDAEDAFQATFLVLVRKAASVKKQVACPTPTRQVPVPDGSCGLARRTSTSRPTCSAR
jgi:hypothetical protein